MGMSRVEALSYGCDDGDCGRGHTVTGDEVPPGFELTVKVHQGGERVDVPVYACRITHVRGAVEAVLAENGDDTAEPVEADPRDFDDDGDANQLGEHQLAASGREFDTDRVPS